MTGSVEEIVKRNKRVEADKAWETSWTRRLIIVTGTYIIVALYLNSIHVEGAFYHAVVPAGAYLISTLALPRVKKFWLEHIYFKNEIEQ